MSLCQYIFLLMSMVFSHKVFGLDSISDMERHIAAAHAETAQGLRDGNHHLNIHSLQLPANQNSCAEHFRCWMGNFDERMSYSTQLFLGGVHSVLDVTVAAQQRNILVYAGCNNSFSLLDPSFIHNTDYKLFLIPRSVLEQCGIKLQIQVKKILKSKVYFKHHGKSMSIQLIVDLVPSNYTGTTDEFRSRFHETLKHKQLTSNTNTPKPKSSTVLGLLSLLGHTEHPKKGNDIDKNKHRQRRAVTDSSETQACSLVRKTLNTEDLQEWMEEEAGYTGIIQLVDHLPFYHCTGRCLSIRTFPELESEPSASVPLRQQRQHDQFWMTSMKLKSVGIIDSIPMASCLGYQYEFFSIQYVTSGDTIQQEYVYYPTKCTCA